MVSQCGLFVSAKSLDVEVYSWNTNKSSTVSGDWSKRRQTKTPKVKTATRCISIGYNTLWVYYVSVTSIILCINTRPTVL